MPEPVIDLRGVVVGEGPRPRVGPVTLAFEPGRLTALVGPNGSGKTSLLKAVAGLEPHAGEILFAGADAATLEPRARARAASYVPQQSSLASPLLVTTVVAQGLFARGRAAAPGAQAEVEAALARVDATQLASRRFTNLSLGEQRRVLLARAIVSGAPAMLLDEPDAYLDVGQRARLFSALRELADDGLGLVVVVHSLAEAALEADRVVVLVDGEVVADAVPEVALDDAVLERAFGVRRLRDAAPRFVLTRGSR